MTKTHIKTEKNQTKIHNPYSTPSQNFISQMPKKHKVKFCWLFLFFSHHVGARQCLWLFQAGLSQRSSASSELVGGPYPCNLKPRYKKYIKRLNQLSVQNTRGEGLTPSSSNIQSKVYKPKRSAVIPQTHLSRSLEIFMQEQLKEHFFLTFHISDSILLSRTCSYSVFEWRWKKFLVCFQNSIKIRSLSIRLRMIWDISFTLSGFMSLLFFCRSSAYW